MTRLAPGPYGSMLLADLGAEVIVVGGGRSGLPVPALSRGKDFISLDLKSIDGIDALHQLVFGADVFMEGFRPGVADRLGAGYHDLSRINKELIYCSVTGYGQTGPLAPRAGHDINYLAISGALGTFGQCDRPPVPPLNILADFAGGGMLAALGVVTALYERNRSGRGQYIDAAMVDGVLSMMGMNFADWQTPTLLSRGDGVLAGNMPVYRCYQCSDDKFVAVGALERAFFCELWSTLGFDNPPNHLDRSNWAAIEATLSGTFITRTRDEWSELFADVDACVTPVLAPDEVATFGQISERYPGFSTTTVPAIPVLSRTSTVIRGVDTTDATQAVLLRCGIDPDLVRRVAESDTGYQVTGLSWPPFSPTSKP